MSDSEHDTATATTATTTAAAATATNDRHVIDRPPHPVDEPYHVILYYHYCIILEVELDAMRDELEALCRSLSLSGRIRLSSEGINGTNAGTTANIRLFIDKFANSFNGRFGATQFKHSMCRPSLPPFDCLRVLLTSEVTSTGAMNGVDMAHYAGGHLSPKDFHAALTSERKPNTLVLDVRNYYETAIGTFSGAVDPRIRSFNQLAQFIDQNIETLRSRPVLMFCTGGVRCEKAAAYLRSRGCNDVGQLTGGIHCYLEEFGARGEWAGAMTVFDKRGSVRPDSDSNDGDDVIGHCVQCDAPFERHHGDRRCIECQCLVLVCDNCHQAQRFPIHCEEHILMTGTADERQSFLARFSVQSLLAQLAELELAIQHSFDRKKMRRHRNRRTQMESQRQAVIHELERRIASGEVDVSELTMLSSSLTVSLDQEPLKPEPRSTVLERQQRQQQHDRLVPYMPALNRREERTSERVVE